MEQHVRNSLIHRYKSLTEIELPARAREARWPLRLDHCFKRICLDWACNDCWYKHIPKPAEAHLDGVVLERAVQCAEEILRSGAELLRERNAASLLWRGKLAPAKSMHPTGERDG